MAGDFLSNDFLSSAEGDRLGCCWFCCSLCDLSLPLVCPSFVFPTYLGLFGNIAKMRREELRAASAIWILSLQSWFCRVGSAQSALTNWAAAATSEWGFIFSPVSGVLCECPILLTHSPCSNWFDVSCRDLESWPQCWSRQARRLKAFLNSLQDWGIRADCPRCEEAMIEGK